VRATTSEPTPAPESVAAAEPTPNPARSRQHRSGQRMHVPPGTTAAVIPAHNEETVIEATLRSVLTNYLPQDVYVFCDGCTDQTAEIARQYLPAANVIDHHRNIGKSMGIEYTFQNYVFPKGYLYVTVIDADSTMEPSFLYESLKVLRKKNVACVVGQVKSRWEPTNVFSVYRTYVYFVFHAIFKRLQSLTNSVSIASGCATTWKTRVLQQLDFDHRLSTEDIDLTVQVHRKRLGAIKYISSAVVWTQDPFTIPSYRRQNVRWDRAWWEALRKYKLGLRWIQSTEAGRPRLSVIDIGTALLILDAAFVLVFGLVGLPLLLLYPVDFQFSFLVWHVDVSSRAAILQLLAWQYVWIVGMALVASIATRRPRVLLYSPVYPLLLYVDMFIFAWAFLSTLKSLYAHERRTGTTFTSAWISPERRKEA
jgi:poly-beta-1,6-N-acetyl-D-glucosamine synthase